MRRIPSSVVFVNKLFVEYSEHQAKFLFRKLSLKKLSRYIVLGGETRYLRARHISDENCWYCLNWCKFDKNSAR
jgi:hypothetical protein